MPASNKRLTPEDRIDFYHSMLKELSPEHSPSDALLQEVIENLIQQDLQLKPQGRTAIERGEAGSTE